MSSGSKKAESGITAAGEQLYQRGKMTPEEERQYRASFEIGDLLRDIQKYRLGLGQAPSGYLAPTEQYLREAGPLGTELYQTALRDVQEPYATYESTLQPQLQAVEDYINRRYSEKGLLRSGLPIEAMGRAGVELAISEADKRMAYRSQALQRGAGMYDVVSSGQAQRLADLSDLYSRQQSFGQQAMGRQASAAVPAASYMAYPSQARLGAAYGTEAAMMALPGQLIGAMGQVAAAKAGQPKYNFTSIG